MKINSKFFCTLTIYLLVTVIGLASPKPPPPNGKGQGPGLPGMPIDEHSAVLLLLTIIFGVFVLYSSFRKKMHSDSK